MKNFKNLLIIAAVFSLVFSACKYDEGPGISFRLKRQRLSNGWIVTNYKVDGSDNDSLKRSFSHGDSLQMVLAIYQSGSYAWNLQYTESYQATTTWHKYYIANQTGLVAMDYNYSQNSLFKKMGSYGKWTFDKKHSDVHFGSSDLSHAEGEDKPLVTNIVMLKNEMLKLKFQAKDGKTHLVTFEARNKK